MPSDKFVGQPQSKEVAHVVELSEVMHHLASITDFDPAKLALSPGVIFVCGLGFEPRCLAVSRALANASIDITGCAYIQPSTNRVDNETNLSELLRLLGGPAKTLTGFEVDEKDFTNLFRQWIRLSHSTSPDSAVVVDISAMPSRAIILVLHVLFSEDINLTVTYTEAESYHPSEAEYKLNQQGESDSVTIGLESGVSDLIIPQEYPGRHLDNLPDAIILFPSFNAYRSRAIIQKVDEALLLRPAGRVHWIVGVPKLEKDFWRRDAMHAINSIPNEGAPVHEASTFDYKVVFGMLEREYLKLSVDYHITLAPFGSKMQTVSCALLCLLHSDIRIMFAVPKSYSAAHYSNGCSTMSQIVLGSTKDLRTTFKKVGSLEIIQAV